MKDFKIQIPKGYIIDTKNSNLTEGIIKFKRVNSIDWKEFTNSKKLSGYVTIKQFYSNKIENEVLFSNIEIPYTLKSYANYKAPIFANIKEAKSITALIKLMLIRNLYIGDWKPNWDNTEICKYVIENCEGYMEAVVQDVCRNILSFPTKEMAESFIEDNKELLKEYFNF